MVLWSLAVLLEDSRYGLPPKLWKILKLQEQPGLADAYFTHDADLLYKRFESGAPVGRILRKGPPGFGCVRKLRHV